MDLAGAVRRERTNGSWKHFFFFFFLHFFFLSLFFLILRVLGLLGCGEIGRGRSQGDGETSGFDS